MDKIVVLGGILRFGFRDNLVDNNKKSKPATRWSRQILGSVLGQLGGGNTSTQK